MGAALYGLRTGDSINWPDLDGKSRKIRIVRVLQEGAESEQPSVN
jgi:transcription elongation GreA/GreB family factor